MRLIPITLAIFLAAACGKSSDSSNEPKARSAKAPAATAAQKEANDIFVNRCTPCHGAAGGGNGPASASLSPKPRDLRSEVFHGSVTDEHIEKVIQYGGAAVGKSPAMPANPDLADKPEVVQALRAKVRSFRAH
jgi:mono/diheme cytochrome c family protein